MSAYYNDATIKEIRKYVLDEGDIKDVLGAMAGGVEEALPYIVLKLFWPNLEVSLKTGMPTAAVNLANHIRIPEEGKFLNRLVARKDVDWEQLRETVGVAVRYLNSLARSRFIAVGVTGVASALEHLELDYRSEEARELAWRVAVAVREAAREASEERAATEGVFDGWEESPFGPDETCLRDERSEERIKPMLRLYNPTTTATFPCEWVSKVMGVSVGWGPSDGGEDLFTPLVVPLFDFFVRFEEGAEEVLQSGVGAVEATYVAYNPSDGAYGFGSLGELADFMKGKSARSWAVFVNGVIAQWENRQVG